MKIVEMTHLEPAELFRLADEYCGARKRYIIHRSDSDSNVVAYHAAAEKRAFFNLLELVTKIKSRS